MDYQRKIKEIMDNHEYTCLVAKPDIEVWQCKKPYSGDCQFEIVMTRRNIAMLGDYGDLVFNVGIGYGLKFLAKSSKQHIHDHLNSMSKGYELDEEKFFAIIKDSVIEILEENPEYKSYLDKVQAIDPLGIHELHEILDDGEYVDETMDHMITLTWDAIHHTDDLKDAHELMNEHSDIVGEDSFEYNIQKIDDFTMYRIWALDEAANAIIKIKESLDDSI